MLPCDPASSHGGYTMKLLAAIGVLLFVSVPAHAQAAKSCEELKDEITKKLDAKGVKGYTLDLLRAAVASAYDFAFRVLVLRDDFQRVALHSFFVELLGDFILQLFTRLCRLCVSGDGNK